jgi:hypothetical protein
MKQTPLTPPQPRHILTQSCRGWGLLVDLLATRSECRCQATHCRRRANMATDERLRALWSLLGEMWTKFRADGEEVQPEAGGRLMRPQEKPKSRLAANAEAHEGRILFPGRKVDDVTYLCEECGAEALRSVPPEV